jgi:alpha-1,3-rhamnosyl/mannosyltransferase
MREEHSLVLAGVGNWRPSGVPEGVRLKLLPSVPEAELPALYAGASAFVFPSLKEGFGYPPLEAMACNCPVASSSASCLPEVLGDACEYFDPLSSEAIAAGIAAALRRTDELKKKGQARAALYSAEKSAARMLSIFQEALTSSGGGN